MQVGGFFWNCVGRRGRAGQGAKRDRAKCSRYSVSNFPIWRHMKLTKCEEDSIMMTMDIVTIMTVAIYDDHGSDYVIV